MAKKAAPKAKGRGAAAKNNLGGCEGWHGYLTNGMLVACE